MSEAKTLYILQRIDPLAAYFGFRSQGVGKMEAGALVSFGCSLNARTIIRLGNEFVDTQAKRYVSTLGATVSGRVQRKRTAKLIPKEKFKFGKFVMGENRRVRSIMYDEKLRARAKVWLRLHTKSRKGQANFKSADFLEYLNTDLLKDQGLFN